jgi:glutamate-1-semialdehyde 2,1-aminomutase
VLQLLLKCLQQLTPESYQEFVKKGDMLEEGISKAAAAHGIPHTFSFKSDDLAAS